MSAANKAKGSLWETSIENYLNNNGLKARRLPRAGAKDIGDISVTLKSDAVLILEAKNVSVVGMKEFLRQSDAESENYEAKYGNLTYPLVVVKARGENVSQGRVTMTLETLMTLLHQEGLS